MTLFEITTGWMGESYERCYVWAETAEQARALFDNLVAGNPKYADREDRVVVYKLFSADAAPFITKLSDSAFDSEGVERVG